MIHHHIYEVKNFTEHKKNLIDLIFKIPLNPLKTVGEQISHQDFNLPKETRKEYFDYFKKYIFNDFAKSFCSFIKVNSIQITNLWFQVYEKNDFHEFHTHTRTNFTNVFYLNLPSDKVKTDIKLNNKKINLSVKEGDILSFPAYYPHQSPKNIYDENKIVISFNMDCVYGKNYGINKL